MRDLLLGLTIGTAAGISPGPLLFLVIAATLRSGRRAGVAAALSPLATDLVVVAVTLAVIGAIPRPGLYLLGVLGGGYVCYLGASTVREARTASLEVPPAAAASSFAQACVVNITSPHPWLTWATVLGPLTAATWQRSPAGAVTLVTAFYVGLVGAKVLVALGVASTRHRLSPRGYRIALRSAGIALLVLGLLMVLEFLRQLAG